MKAVVLAYHSHHVLSANYAENDHLALPVDLATVTAGGWRIVPLERIVDALVAARDGGSRGAAASAEPLLALTFDDGPVFDLDDFVHPVLGFQRGFVGAMRDFGATAAGLRQPELSATSFVIASPEARKVAESTFDRQYTYLVPGALDDAWWTRAIESGLLAIANHSWDHLHPALPRVAHSADARADFTRVASEADADAQILAATRYLRERTAGRAAPYFAYPFGHWNDFLADDYLPRRRADVDVRAAFTTEPRPVRADDSVYRLPRYVCGQHWKHPDELAAILAAAVA
jgi:peptidoglycan/xylan/chitin deacetylase (PgdA/CDA1 family)